MMLTLGQAAKEVGKSKTAISNAIKNGRLSAQRNDLGHYMIDPAALFSVYPPKQESERVKLTKLDLKKEQVDGVNIDGSSVNQELLEAKNAQIELLKQTKDELREDLNNMKEQNKRITLLLENRSSGAGEWKKSFEDLEKKVANQEERLQKEKEERERIEQEALEKEVQIKKEASKRINSLKNQLLVEKNKSLWQKLFG